MKERWNSPRLHNWCWLDYSASFNWPQWCYMLLCMKLIRVT